MKHKNLVGQEFNFLKVIEDEGTSHFNEGRRWICECKCGNKITVTTQRLRSGSKKNCGCFRNDNRWLLGQKVNYFEVLKQEDTKGKNLIWSCRCICGKIMPVRGRDLCQGRIRSCGCMTKQEKWAGYGEISGTFWSRIKSGAKQRNVDFDISIQQAWDLYIKQNCKCALSGRSLVFATTTKNHRGGGNTASLDRKDSTKGYTIDNIQWVHKDINLMKHKYDQDYFIRTCKEIALYHAEVC